MKKLFVILVMVIATISANAQRTTLKVSDLQKSITDNVSKSYTGFTIKEATKVLSNNVTTYEVVVTKGMDQKTLLYDNNGNFLRTVGAKAGTTAAKHPSYGTTKKGYAKMLPKK